MALLRLLNGRYQTKVFHINRNINYVAQYCGTESILAIYICKTNKGVLSLNSWCFKNIRQWIIPFCDTRFFLFFGMSPMFSVSQICLLGLCATQLLFCNECCVDCELTAVTLVNRFIAPIYAQLESGQERKVFHFCHLERL